MALSEKPTIIFAHGLWVDGSCWSDVIPPLKAAGFETIAVQNPLTSLEDDSRPSSVRLIARTARRSWSATPGVAS
jgi:hypothetical protein